MRWIFADPANAAEMAYRKRTLAAIDAWWRAFQAKTTDLDALFHRKSDWDLPRWMHDHLGAVDPRLMWEYGQAVRQSGHRLVITPEQRKWLRPLLRTVLERAPKIAGWEFYPHRLPEDVPMTIQMVEARVGVNITGAVVAANVAPGRKIDLAFAFPQQPHLDEATAHQAAFVATETLMGEHVLDTWIGGIGLIEGKPANRPLPMDRAQATVGALIQSIQEQLPPKKLHDIGVGEDWANCQLEPEQADDYVGRQDLIVASTQSVDLFRAAHSSMIFTSSCHSRFGELFCYLKIDGSDVPREHFVEFRSNIEDALNPLLVQAAVGCCIGGGSGIRYSYLDLALTDLNQAIPILRQVLATRRVPLRSWLLFFDDELAQEWVGIYAQTPEPPLPVEEEGG
jgi:hypothetical protein